MGYSLTALRACPSGVPSVAAEQRQPVAHGVSRGWANKQYKPRRGERDSKRSESKWRFASQAIAICFLFFVVIGCGDAKTGNAGVKPADSTNITDDITIKVLERDRDKDGKPDSRIEQYFRGEQRVMMVFSERSSRGDWVVTSRTYSVDGSMVAIEADEDWDGVFETFVVYRNEGRDLEVFDRTSSGSVHPASTRVVEAHKKQSAAFTEFFEELADKNRTPTNLDVKIIEERIRATQKKVQEAQKEINESKQ